MPPALGLGLLLPAGGSTDGQHSEGRATAGAYTTPDRVPTLPAPSPRGQSDSALPHPASPWTVRSGSSKVVTEIFKVEVVRARAKAAARRTEWEEYIGGEYLRKNQ